MFLFIFNLSTELLICFILLRFKNSYRPGLHLYHRHMNFPSCHIFVFHTLVGRAQVTASSGESCDTRTSTDAQLVCKLPDNLYVIGNAREDYVRSAYVLHAPAHFYRTQLIAEKIAYVFGDVRLISDHCLAVIKLADLYIRIERAVQCRHRTGRGRMLSLEQLSQMVKEHLGLSEFIDGIQYTCKWTINESPLSGRGLIATEDIMPGEVLFVDRPLIYGPRSGVTVEQGCTVCGKLDSDTFYKCAKCSLLLCSGQCQNTNVHFNDCGIISHWNINTPIEDVDGNVLSRSLTPIRALMLNNDQKIFLASLQAHTSPQHGAEIRNLKQYYEIPEEEEQLMLLACCVLDTNAYQIATPYGKKEMSMRGLYPVSGLMNHNCVPNTRYYFNSDLQMTVKAVKPIRAGTEIFSCYSGILWGTPARRTHLYKTKHFLCKCDRCSDPTERGTLLGALKCFSPECSGCLLPIDPLKPSSAWRCLQCEMRVPDENVRAVQGALGSLMGSLNFESVRDLESFLINRIIKYVPKTNQIVVDLQCRLIWAFGEVEGYRWHELSESRLALKESLCRGTLRTVAALGVGDAHLRGLLLYHLHAALAERARRSPDLYEEIKSEIESTIEQAYIILQGDISAPPDLELRRRYLGPGCDKPQEERFFILDA